MKKLILHAREYAYPKIDLPDEISNNYDVRVTETLQSSINFTKQNKGIEGVVLGVIMARSDVFPEKIDETFERKRYLLDAFITNLTDGFIANAYAASSLLFESPYKEYARPYDLLEEFGGMELFMHLLEDGYVGKKPVLFLTAQADERGVIGRDREILVPQLLNLKVEAINLNSDASKIINWFNKNLPLDAN